MLSVTTATSGLEGDGFPVRRAFAGVDLAALDPFVHMDQMGEVDYAPGEPKGTPWHPHRGFETVTYMIDGIIQHQDSNGGGSLITDSDTQWMTAGTVSSSCQAGGTAALDRRLLSAWLRDPVHQARSCVTWVTSPRWPDESARPPHCDPTRRGHPPESLEPREDHP